MRSGKDATNNCAGLDGSYGLGRDAGLPPSKWRSIRRAGNGDLWAQGRSQVALLRGGSVRFQTTGWAVSADGVEGNSECRFFGPGHRRNGRRTGDTGLKRMDDRRAFFRFAWLGILHAEDCEGSLWVGLEGRGLVRWPAIGSGKLSHPKAVWGAISLTRCCRERRHVGAGTEAGLSHGRKNSRAGHGIGRSSSTGFQFMLSDMTRLGGSGSVPMDEARPASTPRLARWNGLRKNRV